MPAGRQCRGEARHQATGRSRKRNLNAVSQPSRIVQLPSKQIPGENVLELIVQEGRLLLGPP